jgi:AcrR family transcriptional regulator
MATTQSAERTGRASRARIIEIAFDHFAANGYRGTSMTKIAAEAGMSHPGLLHHFPSKEILLEAVLKARDEHDLDSTDLTPEALSEMEFDELLTAFEGVVRHNARRRNLVQFSHLIAAEATGADHPAHDWVLGRMVKFRELCIGSIERSIQVGTARADVDAGQVTAMLIAASEGLENQWLVDSSVDLVGGFVCFANLLREYVAVPA